MPTFSRPTSRAEFKIAVICALPLEADAVEALFDEFYDEDGYEYGKAPGDPNAYTTGRIGQYSVVLAHMPGTDARLQNIDEAHENTCLWLLEQPEYQHGGVEEQWA
ncbi:hypothetical protein VTN77DRAFT_7397 [Rasamsonia byssochlamydoides]|uniref:uncharacterized protein n=1 Tax=Rasamsonia byssochlamydoides TaxID=89139 RepID=UPI0037447EE8